MKNTVLLAVDLNDPEASKTCLQGALDLLQKGGKLHVVSVSPSFGMAQVSGFFPAGFEQKHLDAFSRGLAAWVKENVPPSIDAHPHVLHGTVYDEILRASDRLSAEVIVIGSHRPDFKDYLLGPNAARVVRHAKTSVYVVRT